MPLSSAYFVSNTGMPLLSTPVAAFLATASMDRQFLFIPAWLQAGYIVCTRAFLYCIVSWYRIHHFPEVPSPAISKLFTICIYAHTTTITVLWPFFLGQPGWAGARREHLDFMVQGKINSGTHTDHPHGCHSIRTKQCPPPPSPIFYRPDALPATQPTVSKHWRQLAHSD